MLLKIKNYLKEIKSIYPDNGSFNPEAWLNGIKLSLIASQLDSAVYSTEMYF